MAVGAAVNVDTLDANIVLPRTTVTPPFCWPEQTDDGRARGNGEVCRAGISTNVNLRAFGQLIKTL